MSQAAVAALSVRGSDNRFRGAYCFTCEEPLSGQTGARRAMCGAAMPGMHMLLAKSSQSLAIRSQCFWSLMAHKYVRYRDAAQM